MNRIDAMQPGVTFGDIRRDGNGGSQKLWKHNEPFLCPVPDSRARFPITDSRFPFPDHRSPIPDHRSPIFNPAYFNTSVFFPTESNTTEAFAESPLPATERIVPRPKVAWKTMVPGPNSGSTWE